VSEASDAARTSVDDSPPADRSPLAGGGPAREGHPRLPADSEGHSTSVETDDIVSHPPGDVSLDLQAGVLAAAGRQPGVAVGGRVGIAGALRLRSPIERLSLGVELGGTISTDAAVRNGGSVTGSEVSVALMPCALVWFAELCGIIDGGALLVAGHVVRNAREGTLPALAIGARGNALIPLVPNVAAVGTVELLCFEPAGS